MRVASLQTDCPIRNQNVIPMGAATNVRLDPTSKSTGLMDWGDDGSACDCGDGSTVADADVKWQIVGTSLTLYINGELKEAGSLDKLPVPGLVQLGSCGTNRSGSPYSVFGLYVTSQPVVDRNPTSPQSGLSAGAIAGIVIGCLAGLALIGGLGYYFFKKRSVKSLGSTMTTMTNPVTPTIPSTDRNVFAVQEDRNDSAAFYETMKSKEDLGLKDVDLSEQPKHDVPGSYLNS